MDLVRELQTPTLRAITAQEIYGQESEDEQPLMEATDATAEPEAEQEEAGKMRDTGEVSAAEAIQHKPPGHEMWSKAQRKKWRDNEAKKQRKKTKGGRG